MTARVRLEPSGHEYEAEASESLLQAGLRAGLALSYRCNNGSCGECKARVIDGRVAQRVPHDYVITEADKRRGVVLMCSVAATEDVTLEAVEAARAADIPPQSIETKLAHIDPIGSDLLLFSLRTPRSKTLRFLAGQYVDLQLEPNGPRGRLAVASCPCNGMILEFHLRRHDDDAFAATAFGALARGCAVHLDGPMGGVRLDEESRRPMVFIAVDTGFAAIKSLIEHAIALESEQPMHLYRAAWDASGYYGLNLCRAWADALEGFRFTTVGPDVMAHDGGLLAGLAAAIATDHADMAEMDCYVSGLPEEPSVIRERLTTLGVPADRLFVDDHGTTPPD